jgi:hypothetical protein
MNPKFQGNMHLRKHKINSNILLSVWAKWKLQKVRKNVSAENAKSKLHSNIKKVLLISNKTMHHHYKDKSVNDVYGNKHHIFFLWVILTLPVKKSYPCNKPRRTTGL